MKFILAIIFSMTFTQLVFAKNYAYIKTTGIKQGVFKGESQKKGHETSTIVLGLSFEISTPRDASTGLPSGKRQLKPLTITKDWGVSSGQFYTAAATNEILKEVKIEFYSSNGREPEVLEKTIVLQNASILSIKEVSTLVNDDLQDAESITFAYQKITITDKSGVIFTDELIN